MRQELMKDTTDAHMMQQIARFYEAGYQLRRDPFRSSGMCFYLTWHGKELIGTRGTTLRESVFNASIEVIRQSDPLGGQPRWSPCEGLNCAYECAISGTEPPPATFRQDNEGGHTYYVCADCAIAVLHMPGVKLTERT